MTWIVKAGPAENELEIESALTNWKTRFMSAPTMTKYRGLAKNYGGKSAADAYVTYISTVEIGAAAQEHRPGSFQWLEDHGPWHCEPLYDSNKRGKSIVNGKGRLILRDEATALLFKLTWG